MAHVQIYIHDPTDKRCYAARVPPEWLRIYTGGLQGAPAPGLVVQDPRRILTKPEVLKLVHSGQAREVSYDEYVHSSCGEACVRRGAASCMP